MVKKIGNKYFVLSKEGKRLSKSGYSTKEAAQKRLKQIEYFKHKE